MNKIRKLDELCNELDNLNLTPQKVVGEEESSVLRDIFSYKYELMEDMTASGDIEYARGMTTQVSTFDCKAHPPI